MPHQRAASSGDDARAGLRADCERCVGLCCVAPAFAASADFALDKPAGHACPNLAPDSRCRIHDRLRQQGFAGCTVYDCFGAGQKVSQVSFGGQDWRGAPQTAKTMFDVFAVMRDLHELLWYLTDAVRLLPRGSLHGQLQLAFDETERLSFERPDDLLTVDVAAHRDRTNVLLLRASELTRAGVAGSRIDYRGADLVGADLRGADLRGANLRGAHLIAADLRRADLSGADVIGADLRDADIRGADLTGCLFLIQSQLDAAKGDATTRFSPAFARPMHWPQM